MEEDPKKRCGHCKTRRPYAEFGKCKGQPLGLTCWCNPCRREIYNKRKSDPAVVAARRARYASLSPEQKAARATAARRWYASLTPEQRRARVGPLTPEQIQRKREKARLRYLARRDELSARNQQYKRQNPTRIREWSLKKYGLTQAEYDAMVAAQDNRCAICRRNEWRKDKSGKIGYLSVDHCHSGGQVRGLLCHLCNVRVGSLEKMLRDPAWTRIALRYLGEQEDTLTHAVTG